MLLVRYVEPHYTAGVLQVHVLFDNPGGLPESPKSLEQCRGDSAKEKELADHKCTKFTSKTCIPSHIDMQNLQKKILLCISQMSFYD